MSSGNVGNVAGGHKAALKNPNVSEEAKEHSRQVLEDMEQSGEISEHAKAASDDSGKNEGNVIGGYKATLKNPNVGEEAKERAKEVLESKGVSVE